MQARTQSYLAKNLKVQYGSSTKFFHFVFENHRTAIPKPQNMRSLEDELEAVANQACILLFKEDILGALLNERLKGETFE